MTNKIVHTVLLISFAGALAGCGGGSDGDSQPGAKYAGTWVSPCISVNGRQSLRQQWEVKEVHGADLGGTKISTLYGNSRCSGTPKSEIWYYIDGDKAGTRQTGSGEGDMLLIHFSSANGDPEPAPDAQLWLLKDGLLYMGDKDMMAPDGYPSDVDLSLGFSRR